MEDTPRPTKPVSPSGGDPAVRTGIVIITLVVLAVSVGIVYMSTLSAIHTWLEDRWVDLANGAFALLVAALCIWVLKRLTGYRFSS